MDPLSFLWQSPKEEPGYPGAKITFQYKTEKDKHEVETEVSFEIYFKQVPGAPVTYPVEDYNDLFNFRETAAAFFGIGIACLAIYFIPEETIVTIFASKAYEMFKSAYLLLKLAFS